jgi:diguanylate cyclase (GGDEF)-like protein
MIIGLLVFLNNRKAPANKVFFALTVVVTIWSIGLGFATVAPDVVTSEFWRRVSAFGWGTAFAIILHFILIITGHDLWLKKWWFQIFLYLPAIFSLFAFSIPSGLNPTPYHLHRTEFGWANVAENNCWDWLFYLYYFGYTVLGLALVWRWGRKATDRNIKMQSRAIFLSFLVTLVLGSITDVLISNIPQMAPIILLLPIVVIYRTIIKYGFIVSEPTMTNRKNHFLLIVAIVILYVLLAFLQIRLSVVASTFRLGLLDGYTLRGIITQLQMLLSIYMVLREGKAGFIAAVLINSSNFLSSLGYIFRSRSIVPLPGTISHLVTCLLITLIWGYKKRTAEHIKKINKQRDILKKSKKKLYQMAYYDSLTGLPNKDWFVKQLNKAIQTAKEDDSLLGVMFLDLDSFKSINDTMGHPTGDSVLRTTAMRISSRLRAEDTITRFGGDEFLIMMTKINTVEELKGITDRIMQVFNDCMSVQDIEYYMTASAGVAVYPLDGEDAETLIKNADLAMYQAKARGKKQCIYCSQTMKDETIIQMKLSNSLYKALDRNELHLHYQPLVRTKTQKIIGFEALLRWENKEYRKVSPEVFIPMAEQTGLIRPIGLWVLKTACEQFKAFKSANAQALFVSINLSIEQLKDYSIAEKISKILRDTEMDAKNIKIEITESIAFNEDPRILQRLKDIRDLGISVSIDDFGKGYSSLNRLKTFPIDLLKIDMDFVRGITSKSPKNRAIIKSIIQIAKNLKIEVLAEGVETKEEYTYLREHGCDIIQGYYFYKPMPAREIENLIL